ncbi:hypothetical protein, partial [Nocardia sp. IFM 10818]
MFRRKPNPNPAHTANADPLLTADLPERVATGRNRLAYQDDPALRDALSERELVAERALAERKREHDRTEQLAEIAAAEGTAAEIRRTTAEIVRTEARDLALSRKALADQRRESSPHAQLAYLYRVKTWSGRGLAGVVAGSMLYSATNVQHNLAPGGPSEPLFWMSYLLEALISTVLVVFMVSGSAVARWKIQEGEKAIQWTEAALLAGSIALNTYPYFGQPMDWKNIGVHSVAPVMMGVALVGHQAVAKRMGAAIAAASLEVSAADDTAERLAALRERARFTATTGPAPAAPAPAARDDEAVLADFEREFTDSSARATDTEDSYRALEFIARATEDTSPIARDVGVERAEIERAESGSERAESAASRATEDVSPIARDTDFERADIAADLDVPARDPESGARVSSAAHSPIELGTGRESSAAVSSVDESVARATEEAPAPDLTPVVALVRTPHPARATREAGPRTARATRGSSARETVVDGALARATEHAPRAKSSARDSAGTGPFARELSQADASRLARAVLDRGKSKQPAEVLTAIYRAHSQGHNANHIAAHVVADLPRSTVSRAIDAALSVSGPRALD